MAQNVTIMGASYSAVPAVTLPKTGGGTARFDDASVTTATASDVASGKVFVAADGTITTGTGSGGDNSLIVTLSWDDDYYGADEGAWVPDCTFAEVQAAYQAEKTITVATDYYDTGATADGYFFYDDGSQSLVYCVESFVGSSLVGTIYIFSGDGLDVDDSWESIVPRFDSPTRTYTPSLTQQTETITYDTDYYNGIEEVNVTVGAIPLADEYSASIGPDDQFVTITNKRYWQARARFLVDVPGWVSGDVTGNWQSYSAVPANTTITPSTSAQTVGGSKYMMEGAVTVEAMPTGTAGTPTATKGAVSSHSVNVTPSVTNTTGYITGGTKTGTAVSVTASELVSGSQTVTQNDTYDVTNLAELVVNVSGGSGDLMIATATSTPATASHTITFTGLSGEPTSFHITCQEDLATASQVKVAAVAYDGTDHTGQTVTNTSNAQASFDDGFSHAYSNGTLTVTATTAYFQAEEYALCYTYGGGSANIGTKDVQVGSGATSITFTGLSDEPSCWSCVFTSNFSTSSGYQRVMAVANDGTGTYGLEMDSAAHHSDQHWTSSYSNGSLTITSQGTNAGGYFHQPGNYHLTYAVGGKVDVTVEPLTVTQNGVYSEAGKAYSPVTVNVSGGGGASVDVTTWTNNSTSTVSHQFTGLKGTPKAAFLRCTSQLTRSSSNTYYYIADIVWDGTNAYGNYHLRSNGSYNNVASDAQSGFNVTVGTNSITFSSDATSRSSAPGSFYNGTYELTYVY